MIDQDHIIKKSFDNYKNNFIVGEIYIEEKQINKEISIINSYENYKRKGQGGYFKNINEREIMEKCVIKINDEEIPFTYYYTFHECGKYKIEYSFKH